MRTEAVTREHRCSGADTLEIAVLQKGSGLLARSPIGGQERDVHRHGAHWRSHLCGRHDPEFSDGGVSGAGDHVGDAVGNILGGKNLGLLVEGVDHLFPNVRLVVRAQFGRDATRLEWSCPDSVDG